MNKSDIFELVYDLVRQIPKGKVSTYGDIARVADINPRYVGYILHCNPYPGDVPCHRVINAQGKVAATFAFGGGDSQQRLLEAEGVSFCKDRVDLGKNRFTF